MDVHEVLSRPADEFGNAESLEQMWAARAFEHAVIYFDLLCSVDPKLLRLTPLDDVIYEYFGHAFPDLNVRVVDENKMKDAAGKSKWRVFCERFKDVLEDYNYGTLLRTDCTHDYNEDNSILVPRVQFLAIELARNRGGHNDSLRHKFRQTKTEPS